MNTRFILNGRTIEVNGHPGQSLLEYLRENGLCSVKYGCDHGECGACTVLIDDLAVNSCLILVNTLAGKSIETLEFLNKDRSLTDLQEKFISAGAIQCGYCTPGMLLSMEALIRKNPVPSDEEVRDSLAGNLCRCTGYVKPVEAMKP